MGKKNRKRATEENPHAEQPEDAGPAEASTRVRVVLTCIIAFHFLAIFTALGSNLFQSRLQQNIMTGLSPYLVSTAQRYGTTPLEITHGEVFDFPLRLDYLTSKGSRWQTISTHGLDKTTRTRWTSLLRTIRFILADDYESELLSELVFNIVQVSLKEEVQIDAVRIVQSYVPTFDEATTATSAEIELDDLGEESVLFEAQVVRMDGEIIGLNPKQEAYRSSQVQSPPANNLGSSVSSQGGS